MQKRRFPWILAAILVVAFFGGHLTGLILAVIGCGAVYGQSVRRHPRSRHTGFTGCGGTGEVRSRLFPWVFYKCPSPRCNGGRIIRFGARRFGPAHVRAEYQRVAAAKRNARENHAWR
jgi:hypothetical protein